MRWILYIFLGMLPGVIWALYYLREDKKNPEPKGKIIQVFLLGMLITIPAAIMELVAGCALGYACPFYSDKALYFNILLKNSLMAKIISVFFVIAVVEETFKFIVIKSEVLKNKEFDEPIDGMIYAIIISLGFASAENILYIFTYSQAPFHTMIERFFTAILIHALTGGIIGYYIGKVKLWEMKKNQFLPGIKSTKKAFKYIVTGLLLAIAFHGAYNLLLDFENYTFMLIIFAMIIFVALLVSLAFDELRNNPVATKSFILYNNKNK